MNINDCWGDLTDISVCTSVFVVADVSYSSPRNYILLLSKTIFIRSNYQQNIEFNFENTAGMRQEGFNMSFAIRAGFVVFGGALPPVAGPALRLMASKLTNNPQ